MITVERTEGSAYDTMMSYVDEGMIPACVPVSLDGEQYVWTTGAEYDPEKINDDLDSLALCLIAITRAYRAGSEYGLVPVL